MIAFSPFVETNGYQVNYQQRLPSKDKRLLSCIRFKVRKKSSEDFTVTSALRFLELEPGAVIGFPVMTETDLNRFAFGLRSGFGDAISPKSSDRLCSDRILKGDPRT